MSLVCVRAYACADAPSPLGPLQMMPVDKRDSVESVALVPRLILQRDVLREASKVIWGQTAPSVRAMNKCRELIFRFVSATNELPSPRRHYCSRKVDILCQSSRSFFPSAPGAIASRSRCAVMVFRFRKSRATCCRAYSFTSTYGVVAPLVACRYSVILRSRCRAAMS